jgi:nitronate monooxygenase
MDPAYQLEAMTPEVLRACKVWGNIPLIVAGGVWNRDDIEKFFDMGVSGVQMATRFIGTHECDASDLFKRVILEAGKADIKLIKSPVGYPARGVVSTPLMDRVLSGQRPRITCISNCVDPCDHGKESNKVGYCIADALGDARNGVIDTGLFFTGSNGYRVTKLQHVSELVEKLTGQRADDDTWIEDPSIPDEVSLQSASAAM